MNKELEALTKKYFWEQKIKEVFSFILIVTLIIFLPYFIGNSIGDNANCIKSYGNQTNDNRILNDAFEGISLEECKSLGGQLNYFGSIAQWFEGLSYLILLFALVIMIGVAFIILSELFMDWIGSNWKKAKRRANKDLKRRDIKTKRGKK